MVSKSDLFGARFEAKLEPSAALIGIDKSPDRDR